MNTSGVNLKVLCQGQWACFTWVVMIPGIREVSLLSWGLCRLAACYVVTEPGAGLRPTQLTSLLQHTERQPLCPAFVGGAHPVRGFWQGRLRCFPAATSYAAVWTYLADIAPAVLPIARSESENGVALKRREKPSVCLCLGDPRFRNQSSMSWVKEKLLRSHSFQLRGLLQKKRHLKASLDTNHFWGTCTVLFFRRSSL